MQSDDQSTKGADGAWNARGCRRMSSGVAVWLAIGLSVSAGQSERPISIQQWLCMALVPNFGPHSPLKSLAGAHPEVYWTIWLGLVNSNKLFANSKFVEEKSKTISYFKFCFPLCAELCSRLPEGSREFQGLPGSSHRNHWTFQASWQHLRPFLLLPN